MAPLVIIDSSVWVQYFRAPDSAEGEEVERLIRAGEVAVVGAIYAELVHGARDEKELRRLEEDLNAFPFFDTDKWVWRRAGRLLFELRRQGVTVSLADAVIAAIALEAGHEVYTLDEHFQRVPGLRLHEASGPNDQD